MLHPENILLQGKYECKYADVDTYNCLLTAKILRVVFISFSVLQDIRHDAETTDMLDDFSASGRKKISDLRNKIAVIIFHIFLKK